MNRYFPIFWMNLIALSFITLFHISSAHADDPIKVCVSIISQKYFVVRIGGARQLASALGAQVIHADPLAEHWMANLKQQAEQPKKALR